MKKNDIDLHHLDLETYELFFQTSAASTPFHSLRFLKAIANSRKELKLRFMVLTEKKETIAVLPYFSRKRFPFKLKSTIDGCYGGFIYRNENRDKISDFLSNYHITGWRKTTVNAYRDRIYDGKLFSKKRNLTWVIDTDMPYTIFLTNLHAKTRNQIKRAQALNVCVQDIETHESLQEAKRIYHQLIAKHAIASPHKDILFDNLFAASKTDKNILFKIASLQNRVIAFSIFLSNRTQMFYWINASNNNFLKYNGTNAILHDVAQYCTQQSLIEELNMGAVPYRNDSLLHFKQRWGAREKTYYTYTQ